MTMALVRRSSPRQTPSVAAQKESSGPRGEKYTLFFVTGRGTTDQGSIYYLYLRGKSFCSQPFSGFRSATFCTLLVVSKKDDKLGGLPLALGDGLASVGALPGVAFSLSYVIVGIEVVNVVPSMHSAASIIWPPELW